MTPEARRRMAIEIQREELERVVRFRTDDWIRLKIKAMEMNPEDPAEELAKELKDAQAADVRPGGGAYKPNGNGRSEYDDDDMAPKPEPQRRTGFCALDPVERFLRRFIIYPSDHAAAAHVLWIAHTHLMDCWDNSPRLAFMSPEKESGKTKALEMTALFVNAPELVLNASPAAIVRIVALGHDSHCLPTILHDEIDNVFRSGTVDPNNATLLAVFNQGYMPGATVPRCIGQNMNIAVARLPCYCPIAFAGLRKLPDTLASRTIRIPMKRRAPDEYKESVRRKRHTAEAAPIAESLVAFCGHISGCVAGYEPEIPAGIEDRTADCWEPLLAIADHAGGDWPDRARAAAICLTGIGSDDEATSGIELLGHVRDAFLEARSIWTTTLLDRLHGREESPWKDIGYGRELDDRGLADRLRPYGIKSGQVKIDGTNRKGYYRSDFEDAWKRYL